jgi:hypothetical protein
MWGLRIRFALDLLSKSTKPKQRVEAIKRVLNLFEGAWEAKLLALDIFPEWLLLLKDLGEEENADKGYYVLQLRKWIVAGTERWPDDANLWISCLSVLLCVELETKAEALDVKKMFERCIQRLTKQVVPLKPEENPDRVEAFTQILELYVNWTREHLTPKDILRLVETVASGGVVPVGTSVGKAVSTFFKPLLLEVAVQHLEKDGILAARKFYKKYKDQYPLLKEFCLKMIELELDEDNEHYEYDVTISLFKDATIHFGTDDAQIWNEYVNFELEKGKPENVGKIYYLATKTLNASECNDFISIYSLKQTDRQNY